MGHPAGPSTIPVPRLADSACSGVRNMIARSQNERNKEVTRQQQHPTRRVSELSGRIQKEQRSQREIAAPVPQAGADDVVAEKRTLT